MVLIFSLVTCKIYLVSSRYYNVSEAVFPGAAVSKHWGCGSILGPIESQFQSNSINFRLYVDDVPIFLVSLAGLQ